MIKSTLLIDDNKGTINHKKIIDSSYLGNKLKSREISPIVTSSRLQTSKVKIKPETVKTVYKLNKDILSTKPKSVEKNKNVENVRSTIDNQMAKSIKGIPIKFFNEAIKGKTLSNIANSDRLSSAKSSLLKKNFLKK